MVQFGNPSNEAVSRAATATLDDAGLSSGGAGTATAAPRSTGRREVREDVGGQSAAPSPTPRRQPKPREEVVDRSEESTPRRQPGKAPQAEAEADDSDDDIYDQLAAGVTPGTGKGERDRRKTQDSPSPTSRRPAEVEDDDTAGSAEGDDRAEAAGEGEASEGDAEAGEGEAEEGEAEAFVLSDEDKEILKRTHRSLPSHVWEQMSAADQEAWVEDSHALRRQSDREFQRRQQQQQSEEQEDDSTGRQTATEINRQAKLPRVLQSHIDKLDKEWGGDLAGPLGELTGTLLNGTKQALRQLQNENESLKQQVNFIAGLMSARDAAAAWRSLEGEFQGTRGVKFKNVRAEIEATAQTLLQKRYAKGDYSKSYEELIIEAARGRFFDKGKIKQQVTAELAKSRQNSLAGTSERGNGPRRGTESRKDADEDAYDRLAKGESPEEIARS
jgi:hypothetical protein